ncbi:MAG: hypothetical protein J5802_09050 [Butyrivibrio sp.]|nr:hypothetical protein [Butyrivibrio sp.]
MLKYIRDKKTPATERYNSLILEQSLWQKVKIGVAEDGTKIVENATYSDDVLFPVLSVEGFNEANGRNEEFYISCYDLYEDSRSDWKAYYEETGNSCAYSFPDVVKDALFTRLANIQGEIVNARQAIRDEEKAEKVNQRIKEDKSSYYLIGTGLIGKRDPKDNSDWLFMDGKWTPDDEKIIEKLLNGEDLTKQSFKTFDPEVVELINDICNLEKAEAMEKITDQTIAFLKFQWADKYADPAKAWAENPKWYAKLVSTSFTMNGIRKELTPSDLDVDAGIEKDGFMESIQRELEQDLRNYGAYDISSFGMMD